VKKLTATPAAENDSNRESNDIDFEMDFAF